ncbi:MAG: hypothetical protein V7K15_04965 [Nostoc sp.]
MTLTAQAAAPTSLVCRASCYNSWNPRNALASLRLCGSLRQAEASTLFRRLVRKSKLKRTVCPSKPVNVINEVLLVLRQIIYDSQRATYSGN